MEFHLHVNQPKAIELGVKNISQALVFDLLIKSAAWAKPVTIDEQVYYWVARQQICKLLPILNLKNDTVYRHLKQLDESGLIEYKKQGRNDCIRITDLGKTYVSNSEMNPSKLGNESESNSDLNPIYPNTKQHPSTKDHKNPSSVSDETRQLALKVIAEYHRILPNLQSVQTKRFFTSQRYKKHFKARIKENPETHSTIEFWTTFFQVAKTNDWWMGEGGWKGCNLGWLLNRTNFDKVIDLWETIAKQEEEDNG